MITRTSEVTALIVGGGAAGMTCALFLARADIDSIVLDSGRSTLRRAELRNFPGLEPTLGYEWLSSVREAAVASRHVTFDSIKVRAVGPDASGFFAETEDDRRRRGEYLILATGQGSCDFAESLGLETVPPLQPYVRTNVVIDRWGETTMPNVFACGVLAGWPSQAVICAGSGANVAIRIASRVRREFWVDHDTAPVNRIAAVEH